MLRIQFDREDVDLIIVIMSTRSRDEQPSSPATQEVVIVEKKEEINPDTGATRPNWKQPTIEIIIVVVVHIILYLLF